MPCNGGDTAPALDVGLMLKGCYESPKVQVRSVEILNLAIEFNSRRKECKSWLTQGS